MEAQCPSCLSVFAVHRPGLQYCPRCGARVNVPEPEPQPAPQPQPQPPLHHQPSPPVPAPAPAEPLRTDTPWERRAELGFFRAVWTTWRDSLLSPDLFWRRLHPTARTQDALFYAWLMGVLAAVLTLVVQAPLQLVQLRSREGSDGPDLLSLLPELPDWLERVLTGMSTPGGSILLGLLAVGFTALLYPLQLVIASALLHLFALLFGASRHGYWATFRVVAYSSGAAVLSVVPCFGVLAGVYMLVLQGWGLYRVQETTAGRAALSVIALPLLACVLACAGLGLAIMAVAASLSSMGVPP